MSSNVSSNSGAASAASRWCSHSRHIDHRNNLFSALGVHHMMSFGCGLETSRDDLLSLAQRGPWLLKIAYCIFLIFVGLYYAVLMCVLVLNEICQLTERFVYFLFFVSTLGFFNFSRMNSLYGTSFTIVESLLGNIWHDSTIVLTAPKRLCTSCKAGGCTEGTCYKFVKGILIDKIIFNCSCYKKHLSDRLELAREQDGCNTMFHQSNEIMECKYLWRRSRLELLSREKCGMFNDDVLSRYYDMDRSMWSSVKLITSIDQKKLATFEFGRDRLDETVIVPITSPNQLFQMPELRYAFLKDRARLECGSEIVYTPIVLLKRSTMFAVAALSVRFANKAFYEEKLLASSIVIMTMMLYALQSMRDRIMLDDLGGPNSRVSRMLAIDSLAVGKNLVKYSNCDTTWSRFVGFGSIPVGSVDVLENLLHSRSIAMGSKMVSLSREGTDMFLAHLEKHPSEPNAMLARRWDKADKIEVSEASTKEVLDLGTKIY